MGKIPMSEAGRRRAVKRKARIARWSKIGVFTVFALASVLLVTKI